MDDAGEVLDALDQRRRDTPAARKPTRKLLDEQGCARPHGGHPSGVLGYSSGEAATDR